jgi:kynurenine formamidase
MSDDAVKIDVIEFMGKKLNFLDLGKEVGPDVPVYPGHMKTAFWWHKTHEETKFSLGESSKYPYGFGVKGIITCDHTSTHVDAVYHFDPNKSHLSVDKITLQELITPAAWIDLSFVQGRVHITLDAVKKGLDAAEVTLKPGMSLLYWTGNEPYSTIDPYRYLSNYPGLDKEATTWLLDQGLLNIGTDSPSLDTPADLDYPNHTVHAEREIIHTESLVNITKIPRHSGFYYAMFPLKFVGLTGSPIRAFAIWED